ncbi:lycopene cyclase [Halteromyces radiatus]|uniref:lycopene cyclase n=1 Tax=Halteromyces radiatus TaxID=101107 RepID=UPI00221F1EC3|nr:lycopene cyclase [Halteromyces radiatus]KAI8088750.1 lycopene cyclase [Halteromyces radiatus]
MLSYMEVHLYYTLPVVGFLLLGLRPFYTSQDRLKYYFLCGVAFSTAAPWDNYIVFHRAWWYCPRCVIAVIGYVPLEEYMFFIIMTLMTVSFTNLVMRWHLPTFYLKSTLSSFHSKCIRYIPMLAFLTIAVKAWFAAVPDTPFFYGACILWYVCPVFALLWYGASEYICRRWKGVMISVIVPTLYLCWVDTIAISAGTWHISERTSTRHFLFSHLPLEEAVFFFMINIVLVFATCAIDRAYSILHLYNINRQPSSSSFLSTVIDLTKAFCLSDQSLDPQPLNDLYTTWAILKNSSASFYTASAVFPSNVRQDFGVLYGFCRATDDLADNESVSVEHRKQQLNLVRDFINDLFTQKTNCASELDWTPYMDLPHECLASFRSFVRLRHVLRLEAVLELLDGYTWDLERRPILNEEDLKRYSECVASSVGEMCTRILMNNDLKMMMMDQTTLAWTIDRAREMGLVLQFINIARDIVTDSEQLKRCYIPSTWLEKKEMELIKTGHARQLGDQRLKELALRLIHAADDLSLRARRGVEKLPLNCQGGVRAACAVYCAIGQALKQADDYPIRAHVKGLQRVWITLQNVYDLIGNNKMMTPSTINQPKTRQGKVRSFIVD